MARCTFVQGISTNGMAPQNLSGLIVEGTGWSVNNDMIKHKIKSNLLCASITSYFQGSKRLNEKQVLPAMEQSTHGKLHCATMLEN